MQTWCEGSSGTLEKKDKKDKPGWLNAKPDCQPVSLSDCQSVSLSDCQPVRLYCQTVQPIPTVTRSTPLRQLHVITSVELWLVHCIVCALWDLLEWLLFCYRGKATISKRVSCMTLKNGYLRLYQRRVWCMPEPDSVGTNLDHYSCLRMLHLPALCVRMALLKWNLCSNWLVLQSHLTTLFLYSGWCYADAQNVLTFRGFCYKLTIPIFWGQCKF